MRHLQVLCVGRHRFLAEHFARYFSDLGVDASAAVGVTGALDRSRTIRPDVVVCDYDLLMGRSLEAWEQDAILRETPLVAVSLTRSPSEVESLQSGPIAGFLYLPTLSPEDAHRLLHAAAARPSYMPGGSVLGRTPEPEPLSGS